MTYCLAIQVREGIAFAGDTRSNAGVDYVSAYSKLHRFRTAPVTLHDGRLLGDADGGWPLLRTWQRRRSRFERHYARRHAGTV